MLNQRRHNLKNATKVKYTSGNQTMLDDIGALWEKLNLHHLDCSENFKDHFRAMTFERRKAELLQKTRHGELRVDMALDETGQPIGYCVSSIDKAKTGEIESIYIEKDYRRLGIGDTLMKNALSWMDEKGAEKKTVVVCVGNEQAFGFYVKYGFAPRKTLLEQPKNRL
jgi:ribosomal protein S18 acetylase RimI-like enzyme